MSFYESITFSWKHKKSIFIKIRQRYLSILNNKIILLLLLLLYLKHDLQASQRLSNTEDILRGY